VRNSGVSGNYLLLLSISRLSDFSSIRVHPRFFGFSPPLRPSVVGFAFPLPAITGISAIPSPHRHSDAKRGICFLTFAFPPVFLRTLCG
jgi:hypothetical protein